MMMIAAACLMAGCGRHADQPAARPTGTSSRSGSSADERAKQDAFIRFAQTRPALRDMLQRQRAERMPLGTWQTPQPFWGSSRLRVSADADNTVAMEVADAKGRVIAWARGTLATKFPPSGSLSSPPRPLAPFAKWKVEKQGNKVMLVGLMNPGRSVMIVQDISGPVSKSQGTASKVL